MLNELQFCGIAPEISTKKKCYFQLYKDPDDQLLRLYYGSKPDFKLKKGIVDIREVFLNTGPSTELALFYRDSAATALDPDAAYIPKTPEYTVRLIENSCFPYEIPTNISKKEARALSRAETLSALTKEIPKVGLVSFYSADGQRFVCTLDTIEAVQQLKTLINVVSSELARLRTAICTDAK